MERVDPFVAEARCLQHRSEEHTSELQSRLHLVCRLLLEKKTGAFGWRRRCPRRPATAATDRPPPGGGLRPKPARPSFTAPPTAAHTPPPLRAPPNALRLA